MLIVSHLNKVFHSFVRSFVRAYMRACVRAFVRSFIHSQKGIDHLEFTNPERLRQLQKSTVKHIRVRIL